MTICGRFRRWLRATLHRSRLESEIDAELRFHLDSYANDLISQGVFREEALRRARLEFGGLLLNARRANVFRPEAFFPAGR